MSEPGRNPVPVTSAGAEASLPRWRVFPAIALGVIMATLDASVVNIALPTLQRQFGAPLTGIQWVVTAYTITITGLLLTMGRLADLRGRRLVYASGLAVFTIASAFCGLAPTLPWLIAARVAQGIGAAMVSANGSALLVSAFPSHERGKVLGAFGAMVGIGLGVGSPLGGMVVAHASWRWLFLANLPLGLLALWLVRTRVPADSPSRNAPPLDLGAAFAWCAALVALMLGFSRGAELGWSHSLVRGAFVVAAVALAAFAALESRARHPMLPLRILFGPLGAAVLLTLLSQAMTVSVGLHFPLYLEEVLGFDAQKSGVWNMILPVAALFFAPLAGRLSDRIGVRVLTTLGMGMTAAGFYLLADVGVTPATWHLMAGLALIGAGQGLFSVPNASALLSLVPREQLGIASGLQGTTRNLGITAGATLIGTLMALRYLARSGRVLSTGGGVAIHRAAFAGATHDAYMVMAAVAVVATILAAAQDRSAPAA